MRLFAKNAEYITVVFQTSNLFETKISEKSKKSNIKDFAALLLNNSTTNIEQYKAVFPISNLFEAKIVEKSQKKSNIKDFAK